MYFGLIDRGSQRKLVYRGDSDSGMIIEIDFKSEAVSGTITLTNTSTRESLSLDLSKAESIVGSSIAAGDIIRIDTRVGKKSVTFERSGTYYNILNSFDKGSDWLQLAPGSNSFSYTAAEGVENLEFKMILNSSYEGI